MGGVTGISWVTNANGGNPNYTVALNGVAVNQNDGIQVTVTQTTTFTLTITNAEGVVVVTSSKTITVTNTTDVSGCFGYGTIVARTGTANQPIIWMTVTKGCQTYSGDVAIDLPAGKWTLTTVGWDGYETTTTSSGAQVTVPGAFSWYWQPSWAQNTLPYGGSVAPAPNPNNVTPDTAVTTVTVPAGGGTLVMVVPVGGGSLYTPYAWRATVTVVPAP